MRKRRESKQEHFDLYIGDPLEKRVYDFLQDLSESGGKREWIVQSLARSLPAQAVYRGADPAAQGSDRAEFVYTDLED